MKFIFDEIAHLFLTLLISVFIYLKFHSFILVLVCLLFGFFIDLDHLFDYFSYFGLKFRFEDFRDTRKYMDPSGKVFVPLHGWEFVLVFWILGRAIGYHGLPWAMSISYFIHLLWDNFSYEHHPLTYFFTYRLLNKFASRSIKKNANNRK